MRLPVRDTMAVDGKAGALSKRSAHAETQDGRFFAVTFPSAMPELCIRVALFETNQSERVPTREPFLKEAAVAAAHARQRRKPRRKSPREELQRACPGCAVLYATATGATEVLRPRAAPPAPPAGHPREMGAAGQARIRVA
jgi:hypothetical protein